MATTSTPTQEIDKSSWLTPAEMRTLEAVCDAIIPRVPPPTGESDPDGFYARAAADLEVARLVAETLADESPESRAEFRQLLGLLGNPLIGMLLAGRPQGMAQIPVTARQAALRKMSTSNLAKMRQGFQVLKRLALAMYYTTVDAQGNNPNWHAIGYTPAPPPPSPEIAPKRIKTLPVEGDLELTADAVIVGSGAGGGMMAAELAAAGKDVIVLEKGGYYNEADFTGREGEMTTNLFLRRGLLSTQDLSVILLAGSCLGGGTTINWSTSLRTPDGVLVEWEREHGLTGATGAEHQKGFEVAEQRLGVNTEDSAPNRNNAALKSGCEAMGYSWRTLPRNANHCEQRCGYCGFGCPYGRKQGTMLTFLQDANDRGARIVVRCQVEKIRIEAGRATGVEGWAQDSVTGVRRRVIVRAPTVVVSAGSIESPALLLRSGLNNPNIGKHLRIHPVIAVGARFAEKIETWTGSIQTIVSDQFAHLNGNYGYYLEVLPAHPGLLALGTPWDNGQEHKRIMRQAGDMAVPFVLARDTGEGSVAVDRHGEPVVRYWPNETDRGHLTQGLRELTRMMFAAGAVEVSHNFTPRLALQTEGERPGAVPQAKLDRFLTEIEQRGIVPNRVFVGTAHQMGTCRLGADPKTSVADPYGQVHGVRGLYVADASTFPTASGVNPMLSIYALSYRVAQRIKSET